MVHFRQHDERTVSGEIKLIQWNHKMDLIALGMSTGDIVVHRLVGWQKVWTFSPPFSKLTKEVTLVCLHWRPDGKILAAGYNQGEANTDEKVGSVILIDVEDAKVINTIDLNSGRITFLNWCQKQDDISSEKYSNYDLSGMLVNRMDTQLNITSKVDLLPKLNPLVKSYSSNLIGGRRLSESLCDFFKVHKQESLNLLIVASDSGDIALYSFGIFKCAAIKLENCCVHNVSMSSDFSSLIVLISSLSSEVNPITNLSMLTFNVEVIKENSSQLYQVSDIYSQITYLLYYLSDTMQAIMETWEGVLLELDSKLCSNVQCLDDSTKIQTALLADDFLELLVFGNTNDNLEKFLADLTEKILKKLGHSIELTYSNIQKLVVINVERVTYYLFSFLNTLKGMSLWSHEFGEIGLDVNLVNKALKSVGAFLMKSIELQQVIDTSVKNVKSFFRWLYTCMLRLGSDTNNQPQQDVSKISQQDIQYVADFILDNFTNEASSSSQPFRPTSSNFTLDRVGQYLKDEDLNRPNFSHDVTPSNPWIKFFLERPHLSQEDDEELILFPHNGEKSLIQEHIALELQTKNAFSLIPTTISVKIKDMNKTQFQINRIISLSSQKKPKITYCSNLLTRYFYASFVHTDDPTNKLHVLRYSFDDIDSVEISSVSFHSNITSNERTEGKLNIIDLKFYNHEIISVLLLDEALSISYLVQFPVDCVASSFTKIQSSDNDFSEICTPIAIVLGETNFSNIYYRKMANSKATSLAVSGERKLACVSFGSKRRIRVFEMDSNDDEMDEGLVTETTGQQEKDQQEKECPETEVCNMIE